MKPLAGTISPLTLAGNRRIPLEEAEQYKLAQQCAKFGRVEKIVRKMARSLLATL